MSTPLLRKWSTKLFRVVRQGWANPLDTSFSRRTPNRRWNDSAMEALYCCGSERVARAVAFDIFRLAGVVSADLQEEYRPQLVEIRWTGDLIDIYSAQGLAEAGFSGRYPQGISKDQTRAAAAVWHSGGSQGVLCRSASLARIGQTEWPEPAAERGEVALWPSNSAKKPRLIRRRRDDGWLRA